VLASAPAVAAAAAPRPVRPLILAAEAGLRRNKLTHKHTGLKDLFYALAKARDPHSEPVPETARARVDEQQQNLARIRADRDDLRTQTQLMARIIQVLEVENHRLKVNERLKAQLADPTSVPDLTRRRQH